VHKDVVTKGYVQELKAAGVKVVLVGVVYDEAEWAKALEVDADKVLTNTPQAYTMWQEGQSET
jgi:hypothetical protein